MLCLDSGKMLITYLTVGHVSICRSVIYCSAVPPTPVQKKIKDNVLVMRHSKEEPLENIAVKILQAVLKMITGKKIDRQSPVSQPCQDAELTFKYGTLNPSPRCPYGLY